MALYGQGGLSLVTVKDAQARPIREDTVREGDILVIRGPADQAAEAAVAMGLAFREDAPEGGIGETLFNRDSGLAEVLIPPRSPLIGTRFFPGMVTESGDLIVLAIQRQGEDVAPGEPWRLATRFCSRAPGRRSTCGWNRARFWS